MTARIKREREIGRESGEKKSEMVKTYFARIADSFIASLKESMFANYSYIANFAFNAACT